ncbi:MAG: hypothetical protein WBB23_26285 [Desulforhopalus sp.]
MIYVAVATDLVDGLLIGTGAASIQMAIILALGQVLAEIPEGFATIAKFRDKGGGADQKAAYLLFFSLAGLYMLAAMEDMMREAHEGTEDNRWSALSLLFGFDIFLVISGWI